MRLMTCPNARNEMKSAFNLAPLVLFSIMGMANSRASLGDTEAQCMAKYGSESDVQDGLGYHVVGDRAVTFQAKTASGPVSLRVIFLQGAVAHEEISSVDPSRPLSEPQMRALLDSEGGGGKWRKRNSTFHTDNSGSTYGTENWAGADGATAKIYLTGKASSQDLSGQMELSSKRYAATQAFFDKQDGAY